MARRHYANAAPQLTLNAGMTALDTTLAVSGSFTGWPTTRPYYAVLEYGTANMEIVLVTAVTGSIATVTRAQDGTVAVSHLAGATLDHGVVSGDVDEANSHVNSSTGVHGLTGALVGTTDTQTLTNKTLASPAFTGTPGPFILQSKVFADATARDAAITVPTTGMVVYLTSPGALSLYRGGAWRQLGEKSDTGWITTGMTPGTTGVTITSQRYRVQDGNEVHLYVQGTMGATLAGLLNADTNNTSGDIVPNQTVLQLPGAATPAKLAPLNTGHLGATLTWAVDVDGTVSAAAGIPSATYVATSVFSVGGTYLLD